MATGQNFQQYYRSLQILFFALLIGQVAVCIALWSIRSTPAEPAPFGGNFWLQALTAFSLLLLGLSMLLKRQFLSRARKQDNLQEKLNQYRSALVVGWALMEGATLVNVVFFFLSGSMDFLYVAGVVIVMFVTQMPSRHKLVGELELSAQEQNALDDPNATVFNPPPSKD